MVIAFVSLAIIFAVFVLENRAPVTVRLLSWPYDTSVGLAVMIPLVLGLLIGYGISWGKQQTLRAQIRNAEARTMAAEAKLREIGRQLEVASDEPST